MKKVLVLAIFHSFCNLSFAQKADQLVDAVKQKLNKVNSYQANGRLDIAVPFINSPQSDVTVYYKKPDRLKIVKQGGISILPKGGMSINLSSLLSAGRFTVVDAGLAASKDHIVKLLPLDENSPVVLTTLYINPSLAVIDKALVTSKDNGSYQMDLVYGKYSAYGLPDQVTFTFDTKSYKLPKGITFDYEKGGAPKKTTDSGKGTITIRYTAYQINKDLSDKIFEGKG